VGDRRRQLGIPCQTETHRKWTNEEIQLLLSVHNKRLKLRIPPAPPEHYTIWTKEEDALLGKEPDSEVARVTGRPYKSVLSRRTHVKIPYLNPRYRPWTKLELSLLSSGAMNAEIAKRTGRSERAIRLKRWRKS
jgi:hypothetical protein